MSPRPAAVRFETTHCTLTLSAPRPDALLLELVGRDVGELGDAPFRALEERLPAQRKLELFIDARAATGATLDVSGVWAVWLGAHQDRFEHVSMLTGSPFIKLTAEMVKNFSALGDKMRLYTDRTAFEAALGAPQHEN